MQLFGFEIKKSKDEDKKGVTFTVPQSDDGAVEIESTGSPDFGAVNGFTFDIDNVPEDEGELLLTYRALALQQEIDEAIQEIANEAVISDDMKPSVAIVLDDVDLSDSIKNKIRDEFEHILKLLKFKTEGYNIFRRWYIDGRIHYHKVVDKKTAKNGISALVYIDPTNIKLVREYKKKQVGEHDFYDLKDIEEYFVFSPKPFTDLKNSVYRNAEGLKISRDAIAFVPSGQMSADNKYVISNLYKAIKPYNNLKLLEDAVVIYRVTRAPERRIFYVDVGNLPKNKAEQYLKDIMNRFKNKVVYDVNKGTINNRKKYMSMMEDYWLPRREGGRGTEVSTLPAGQNLGELTDVEYFKTKLYKSLNVPLSRFQQDSSTFNLGRTAEITRDEIKFNKFIQRLRKKFSALFDDLLCTQLLLKNIITPDEWSDIEQDITYTFLEDNYFAELKETEILRDRIQTLTELRNAEAIGTYYSNEWVRKNVLRQTEDEVKENDKGIKDEKNDPRWQKAEDDFDANGGGFNQPSDIDTRQPESPAPEPNEKDDDDAPKKDGE